MWSSLKIKNISNLNKFWWDSLLLIIKMILYCKLNYCTWQVISSSIKIYAKIAGHLQPKNLARIAKMSDRVHCGEPEKVPRLIKDGGVWCGFVVFGYFLINILFKLLLKKFMFILLFPKHNIRNVTNICYIEIKY